ncbi:C-type lectin domain family 17, member A-like [Saccostrea cucullata]|uniref:C-type lectin domain family 17, member A-like n=1 Tax=Saccostrea cuccullata TaxID=36930 RepID=UPI002ED39503
MHCFTEIRELGLIKISKFDNRLTRKTFHINLELEGLSTIYCGLICTTQRPLCVGMLYNSITKSCKILISHLTERSVNDRVLVEGWGVWIDPEACWPGWFPFAGHCYQLHTEGAPFEDAVIRCQTEGAYLVEVDSVEENMWITEEFGDYAWIWLGFNDREMEGTFKWTRPGSHVVFTNWRPGEPSNSQSDDCAGLSKTGVWNDMSCTIAFRFICEKDKLRV